MCVCNYAAKVRLLFQTTKHFFTARPYRRKASNPSSSGIASKGERSQKFYVLATAYSGSYGAAIGGGRNAACGDITITDGVTSVRAIKKDNDIPYSIGAGPNGTCGTITIGGNVTKGIQDNYTYTGTGSGSVDTTPETTGNAVPYIPVDLTPGETEGTWNFVMPDRNVEVNVEYSKYNVTFAEDTKDVEHWDITPETPCEGSTVTLAYSGNMQVESVNIEFPWDGDLSTVRSNVIVSDGMTLTGKLNSEVKITIADGAIVTLQDVTIEGKNWNRCEWAGISCEGDATIVLKGNNYVKGFQHYYPGIYVPEGHTLTIRGGGSLEAESNGFGAGIGGGKDISCGNIRIVGGTIVAYGGDYAAAIGGGENAACGDITITGGIVELSAIMEGNAPYSIGPGKNGTCGTITVGSEVKDPVDFSCNIKGNGTPDTSTDPSERITMNTPVEVTPGETAGTWTFIMPDRDVEVSVDYVQRSVTFAEGTEDVENWSITPESPVEVNTGVTLTYSGSKQVESIRAGIPCDNDISAVRTWVTVPDGATLTGYYEYWGKITIADGATITLQDFSNKNWNWAMCTWAGLNCEGDATIILKGNNVVKGYHQNYPGIHVPEGHTLTIRGDGSLDVKSSVYGAGIGGGIEIPCGNIRIEGGTITAEGGSGAAAIGGGRYAACGDITITDGVTSVTVTKSSTSSPSIGAGPNGTCGTITIGGNVTEPIVGDYTYTGTGSGSVDTTPETDGKAVPYIPVDLTPDETEGTWTFVMPDRNVEVYVEYSKFNVTFAEDTKDVEHWDVTPEKPSEGATVTLTYSGNMKVENVNIEFPWDGDLSTLSTNVIVSDGMTLTGKLNSEVKITIADGAIVTLQDVTIEGKNWNRCEWAGISCEGDATIVLKGNNYVKGFQHYYPGIYVPEGHTLTIRGGGSLEAESNGFGAGIGGGKDISCGNIRIVGGTIVAYGGDYAAAIGGGENAACGDITITGGIVELSAIMEGNAPYSIGPGKNGTCGTITVGSEVKDPVDFSCNIKGNGTPDTSTDPSERITMNTPVEVTPGETAGTWTFIMPDRDVEVSVDYVQRSVTFAEGTEDVENWSITPESPVEVNTGVTLTYSGSKQVESIRAGIPCDNDISAVRTWVTVPDGATLTGYYEYWGKITIADGATITLQDFSNKNWNWAMCTWAGLNCEGDATIILKGNNVVTGYHQNYPGIHVPEGHTLTIRGDGSLDVKSYIYGAGIGGGNGISCGNIRIEGGTITAYSGSSGAAIGGGRNAACGDITITDGVTSVRAIKKDNDIPYSIGAGPNGTCGTITIGGNVTKGIQDNYTYTGTGSGSVDTTPETTGNAVPYIPVDLTPGETEGTWTFVMPNGDVQVSVAYKAHNPADVNRDGTVDVADIATIIDVMAKGASAFPEYDADVNEDGTVDVADIASVIDVMAANARRLQNTIDDEE